MLITAPRYPSWAMSGLAFAAVLALCGACGSADDPGDEVGGEWRSGTEVFGDTVVVRTLSGSVWGDTMQLVPDLAIGEMDGPAPFLFGRISGLDVDPEGRVLVVDAQAREVRVFSSAGEHEFTVGRQGDGPGEFRNPDQARFTSDGGFVVRDLAGRFSLFSRDGSFEHVWFRATGYGTNSPFYVTSGGEVLNPSLPDELLSYRLDGTIADTIRMPTRGYETQLLEVSVTGGVSSYTIPFMPAEHWTMDRDGRVIFGSSDRYALERWEGDGRVLRIERAASRAPVVGAEAVQIREQMVRSIRGQAGPGWQWDGPDIPNEKPAFQTLLPGTDGSIWVLREMASVEVDNPGWDETQPDRGFPTTWERPIVVDVFDADGAYLGPVKAPTSISWTFPHAVVSRDAVWAVAVHEHGHEQVVRLRVAPTQD